MSGGGGWKRVLCGDGSCCAPWRMGEGSGMLLEIEDRPWGSGSGKLWFCHGERRWQGANWPYEIWGSIDRAGRAGRAGSGSVGRVIE